MVSKDCGIKQCSTRSTVLNTRRAKEFVVQSTLSLILCTMYTWSLSCSLQRIYQVLFQRDASSESNCNRNFQGQPAGLTINCSTPLHSKCILPLKTNANSKELLPYTHFYIASYHWISAFMGLLLHVLFFCLNRPWQWYCNGNIELLKR